MTIRPMVKFRLKSVWVPERVLSIAMFLKGSFVQRRVSLLSNYFRACRFL
jgi:hypothetical protein